MNPSDDIGLTDFFVLIYKFFKRNIILISLFTVIGLVLGFTYNHFSPKYYSSEMVGYSDLVEKNIILEILSPLNKLAEEKNYNELAIMLNIPVDITTSIRSIDFATSKHNKTSNNPSLTDQKLGELILTSITTYNKDYLPEIESGIINFINQNSYLQNTQKIEAQKNKQLISKISDKIESFDTAQVHLQKSTMVNVSSAQNPSDFIDSYVHLEKLKSKNSNLKLFHIVSHFYNLSKPSNKSTLAFTGLGVVFFVSGLLIALFKEVIVLSKK